MKTHVLILSTLILISGCALNGNQTDSQKHFPSDSLGHQTKDELINKFMVVTDVKGSYETNVELIKQKSTDPVVRNTFLKHYSWDWYREEYRKALNEWSTDELITIINLYEDNSEAMKLLRKHIVSRWTDYDMKQTDMWKKIEADLTSCSNITTQADKWLSCSAEQKKAYLNGVMNATELTFHNYMKYTNFEYSQITNNPAIYKLCRESTLYPDIDMLIEGLDLFYTEDSILYTRENSVFYTKEDRREEIQNIPVIRAAMIVRDALYDYDIEQQLNDAIEVSQKKNSPINSVEE